MALGSIVIDLLMKTGAFEGDAKKAEKRLQEMGKTAKIAGAAIGGVLASGFALFMKNTMDAEREQAQLAAALKSTGEAAGYSQTQLNAMADQLSRTSTISSGEITEAQTRLLSYSAIAGEQFPRALQLAIDQSVRLGESLTQSAETVGKALEYPAEGVSALTKQGFRFTEEQKKMLKVLEETGRLAEAQAIVMGVMEESYAGAAAAARDTFGGAMSALKNTLNDLMTGQGGSLSGATDAVNSLIDTLNDPAVKQGFESIFNGAIKAIDGLTRFATTTASVVKWLGEEVAARLHGPALDDMVRIEQAIDRQARRLAEFDRSVDNRGRPMAGYDPATGRGARNFNPTLGAERQKLIDLREQLKLSREMAEQAARMANIKPPEASPGARPPSPGDLDLRSDAERKKAVADAARARAQSERELEEAIRDSERAERDLLDAMIQSEQARMGWLTQIEDLAAELAGPAAEAALQFGRAVAAADAALTTGTISVDEHGRYVEHLSRRYDKTVSDIERASNQMTAFADQAARNMQDAFADYLFDPFKEGLSGMLKGFGDIMRRIAAEAAASQVFKALANYGTQNSGTWWGSLLSSFSGTKKAGGGYISGPGTATSDSIPALLSNGEYVIKAAAVSQYGRGFFESLNARRFATGGYVGGGPAPAFAGGAGVEVVVNNYGSNKVETRQEQQKMPDGSVFRRMIVDVGLEELSGGKWSAAGKARFGWKETVG